jgi:hypothetical protein
VTLILQIEPTEHVVDVSTQGEATLAMRAWRGVTPEGVNVVLFVRCVAVPTDAPADVQARFVEALAELEPPQELTVLVQGMR